MNMEISAKYDPSQTEDKWYAWWQAHKFFHSEPDGREPYTIVIPPPNVTGVLHMGHMMNNTLQDVLIRRARMLGKNALWVPGTDHASIATEAKVVGRLAEKGIRKQDLSREEFLGYAWDWTREHGGIRHGLHHHEHICRRASAHACHGIEQGFRNDLEQPERPAQVPDFFHLLPADARTAACGRHAGSDQRRRICHKVCHHIQVNLPQHHEGRQHDDHRPA